MLTARRYERITFAVYAPQARFTPLADAAAAFSRHGAMPPRDDVASAPCRAPRCYYAATMLDASAAYAP